MREKDLIRRLDRRYDKISMGTSARYATAAHVPIGLSFNRTRIADYIAVDMHSAHGGSYRAGSGYDWYIHAPVLHGHEIKVSRKDFLCELRDPSKALSFSRHMHFWWLVAPREVVKDDLPEGWGHLVPYGDGLRMAVKPTPNLEPDPLPLPLVGAMLRSVARHCNQDEEI